MRDRAHPKVFVIETRLLIAYGLIVVLVLATIFLLLFIRRNSHDATYQRQLKRDRERREARLLDE